MKKRNFHTEIAYFAGLFLLALGTALVERADFGMSMVVAPAYLLHLKLSQFFPFFSFGMAEYLFQALLLIIMGLILRRFKAVYICSFITAVLYGLVLDFSIMLVGLMPDPTMLCRVILYAVGLPLCTLGIALLLHAYFPPEAYELFVKELCARFGISFGRLKMAYDIGSLLLAVVMSFAFFGLGNFKGINVGTLISALVNAPLISLMESLLVRFFDFSDRFSWRRHFEG